MSRLLRVDANLDRQPSIQRHQSWLSKPRSEYVNDLYRKYLDQTAQMNQVAKYTLAGHQDRLTVHGSSYQETPVRRCQRYNLEHVPKLINPQLLEIVLLTP